MSLSNQSIVNQNHIENEALVSTVDFRVQSTLSWERSIRNTEQLQKPILLPVLKNIKYNTLKFIIFLFRIIFKEIFNINKIYTLYSAIS